ncbi:MAG TPA: hypothetical protein VI864_02740 [Candidatus Bathyarchaeia archaeon]|nr:hypothetical protein [Candidatus Bathyarchaeia archaeon]
MRFCPCCGFEDPAVWHSYRWVTDVDICRFEDFQREYPQWRDLEIGEIISDRYNYYRRTGKRNGGAFAQRWPKVYGQDYYKSRFFERFKAKRDFPHPLQKRLELEAVS